MSYRRAPSPGREPQRSRFVFLLSLIAIFASLLTPVLTLTATDAAAQGIPPDCDAGFVVDEATNTCVPDTGQLDQAETPTETATTEATEEVTEEADQTVNVAFTKYLCPPQAVEYQQDYGQLSANCNLPIQPPGYTMWHTSPAGQNPLSITINYSATEQQAGQHSFGEQIPPGTTVAVYCQVYDPTVGQSTGTYTPVDASGQVTVDVPPGQTLYCDWYNIPPSGTITVYKWECVEDTEYGRELEYYQGALPDQDTGPCESEHLNLPIHLIHGGPPQDTTTQANGTQFNWVMVDANGGFQVWIEEPTGFGDPMVFCGTLDQPQQTPVQAPGGQISITPSAPTFDYQCNWYNIPVQQNSITVYKWLCEPGTEYGQSLEYYQGGLPDQDTGPCEQEHLNIPIHLLHGGPQQDTTTQANGTQFDDVVLDANGSFQVWVEEPPDFGDPMVFCATLDEDTQSPVTVTDGRIMITPTGQPFTYQCNWYNIPGGVAPTDVTGMIVIEKYWCPPVLNFVQTPTRTDMMGACQEDPGTGANFTLTGPTAAPQTWQDMQPSGPPPQSFNWPDLPEGEYTIAENGLAGWTSTVYCHESSGQPNGAADEMLTGPSVTRTLQPGYTIDCAWFNHPPQTTDNSITVYKWQCEPGTQYGQPMAYYQGENGDPGPCETEHLNIPVHLIHGGPQQDTTTQANGTQFDNIVLDANGGFQIWIEEPDGYGDPMVWCWPVDGDPGANPISAPGGTWTVTPGAEPFSWQCNVYDIPAPEYRLELYKYTCVYTVDRTLGLPDLGTNPGCTPTQGVSFTASFGGNPGSAYYTDANGYINWPGVEGGPWSLTEGALPGYAAPKVYCGPPQSAETPEATVTNLAVTGTLDQTNPHIICYWFNFEEPTENGRITVYKYQCPPGTTATDFGLLSESCTTPHNGIGFNLSGPATNISASTVAGTVDWTNLDQGNYTVTETTVLPGYEAPLVFCGIVLQDGAPIDPGSVEWMSQTVTDRSIQLTLDNFPKRIVCYWYNIPSDYGEITIYKWTCPAGYDLSAWGADPKVDCTQATNGVTFTLTPPAGPALMTDTGDSIDGAVYFGGLDPGAYNVTETVPANTAYVFVLDCTGTDIPKVHQYPLSWGNKLDINVAGGDQIVCHWYNVPKPEKGWVTVTKYVCSTKTFVDKVYCTIYEKGQSIELTQVTGKVSKGVGITNTGGTYTWKDLDPGAYTVTEQGMVPCKMTASMVDGKGNAQVVAGKGTMVNVYNCTSTPGKVPPGKVPTKYPNTGVPPEGVDNLMPAMQGEQVSEPAGTPSPEEEAFYQVDCVSGSVDAGTPAPSTPAPDATMPPIEAEPTEAPVDAATTPSPPATPEVGEGECARGAIPTHLSIESIGVDANFEYKEIVDGLMDQPTGPEEVAWYKDTARLGENNNVVVAGHLNWWNVPEGVFYRLQDMQEGDRIAVTGDDGQVYIYEVRSVTQESNLEPPGVDVIGPTEEPTLTLITCGGAWNADLAEYDQRTVVRAVQVEVQPADTAAGG